MTAPLTMPALLDARRSDPLGCELLVADATRLTYDALDIRSEQFACKLLAAGVGFGTRIGIMLPNTAEFVVTFTAITRIGAVAVPISTLSTAVELRRICRHSNLHLLVSTPTYLHHSFADRIGVAIGADDELRPPYRLTEVPTLRSVWMWGDAAPAWATRIAPDGPFDVAPALVASVGAEVTPADTMAIVYTSGSTADPKGVIHTHGSMLRASANCCLIYQYREGERCFTQMPFFWVGGLTVNLLAIMLARATQLTSASSSSAEVLELLERERATNVMAWPHLARAIAADPTFGDRDLSSVRLGSLYEALAPERRPADPSLINSGLGMTETAGPHTAASMTELPEHRRGSFGRAVAGMQHRVIDPATGAELAGQEVGEVHVRGDTLMAGLVRRERHEVFDPDGWYRTGDLVSRRDGHLHFLGRLDDMIKTSGANVSPREVESVLLGIPGVVAAIVTAVDDAGLGEIVGAAVVRADPALDAEAIRAVAKRELSAYKVPRVIVTLEPQEVPLMSSGKVDRRTIVGMLHRQRGQEEAQ